MSPLKIELPRMEREPYRFESRGLNLCRRMPLSKIRPLDRRRGILPSPNPLVPHGTVNTSIHGLLALCTILIAVTLADGQTNYQRLMSFDGATGANPLSPLIQGSDGHLYGAASSGGVSNLGVIFRINKDCTAYAVLHDFKGGALDGGGPLGLTEGKNDGVLYGATERGGSNGVGVVFKVSKDGSGFQILHSFGDGPQDGRLPFAGVLEGSDGVLYGTTFDGGSNSVGTIFRLNKDGSGYTVLHSFAQLNDGSNPVTGLSQGRSNNLFGTTYFGGYGGVGTVYTLRPDGSSYRVLHEFGAFDFDQSRYYGYYPKASPMEASDGLLYGTALSGGTNSAGVVYRLNADGTGYSVLHCFSGNKTGDGDGPIGTLVEGADGGIYGVTVVGGDLNFGTVFRLSRDGSSYAVLWSFHSYFVPGKDGASPQTGLTQGKDGTLYGTTDSGGASDLGIVFRLLLSTPSPRITSINSQPSGAALSMAGGAALQMYSLQARTNLDVTDSWQIIGSSTADIDGNFQFLDTSVSNHLARFYRCAWLQ